MKEQKQIITKNTGINMLIDGLVANAQEAPLLRAQSVISITPTHPPLP